MVNAGLLSKGTTLSYIENGDIKTIAGVKSVPQIGNDPEKVDVTNLGSSKKRYVKGLQDVDNLEFNVIYKGKNFKDIHRLVELDKTLEWLVMYPDGMTVKFAGEVMLKIDGVEVNAAVGFSIVIVVSDGPNIEFAKEPQRPTDLKANNIQFDQFNLSWSGSGLFRVYVDRQKVGETYNNTFTVKGLKPSTKHVVSVASASGINEVHTVPIEVTTTKLPKITKINVPQRLDLYVDETKQLDVITVPIEAMRAYEHANKAVLDSSVVKIDGDKITGISGVNDDKFGRNYVLNSYSNRLYPRNENIPEDNFNHLKTTFGKNTPENSEIELKCNIEITDGFFEYASIVFNYSNGKTKLERVLIKDNSIEYSFFSNYEIQSVFVYCGESGKTRGNGCIITKLQVKEKENLPWTPAPEDNYSYTSANVTFNDADKSSTEFDIFVHKRERMTSPTKADVASFIL